ncbi:hypothetical protein PVK06_049047 [Gossypium arboreum]|uniref:RNase H type-1 domain-containing protein n=1 Tax=Gossypium arboreum TaxID=29729 RepID=A0ABR0MHM4_GOSAR|nr:hypothetical protein PVK06_049047 [Gossypium arboreum]
MVIDNGDWNLDLFRLWLPEEVRLLTNPERVRRGIRQDTSCHLYGHLTEDILHTLRDCSHAKEIWKQVIPSNHFDSFFVAAVAELWGILDGLILIQKQGFVEVIIQSDNLKNVISICGSKPNGPKSSLIRRIQQILAFEKKWFLNYVPRESNLVADALAKMALTRSETLHMLEDPPLEIKEIMKEDCTLDNMSRN